MKIKKIEALQQEKIFITNALEAQRKLIERHPYMLGSIPSRDKADLESDLESVPSHALGVRGGTTESWP